MGARGPSQAILRSKEEKADAHPIEGTFNFAIGNFCV